MRALTAGEGQQVAAKATVERPRYTALYASKTHQRDTFCSCDETCRVVALHSWQPLAPLPLPPTLQTALPLQLPMPPQIWNCLQL